MVSDSQLYKEIHEQPEVVGRLLVAQRGTLAELARAVRERNVAQVLIAARGTSDNAGRYAQYALGARNRLLVSLAAPSLFTLHGSPPRIGNTLVIGISQSGRSPDIVAVLKEARRQGALTAVLTNDPRSDLAAHGDFVIDLGAGEEKSVAATKTYTAQLAAIALLSASLADDAEGFASLDRLPAALGETLASCASPAAAVAERLCGMERAVVIGRGFNYATAFEMALKLKELTYTIVEPYSSADFQHGPLAMLEQGFPVLVLAARGQLQEDNRALLAKLTEHGAAVVGIGDDASALASAPQALAVPGGLPEWLSPLTHILPGQLLALNIAGLRGHDVDAPRSIRKVTKTR
jgi:glutamine---fructose-6-phosphate transaminase (isomerizing)